ncbi:TPA: CHAD domain-containing protein [Vibrio diabolicus]|uniref:CHAD domain-containing protein n=1 Tax=Vibrio diabolicus TaxID=50719 RepID=UPI00080F3FB0|nr:CHAD domain-containing protein [Vibrio diabolicus]MCS0317046.1 CHAD domain-containing protein [Vibrio diabolicus]OCH70058.1 metal-binding protein [Vibrio diabolicus]
MFRKSSFQLPLHTDSELDFVVPHFLLTEFDYARSLEQGIVHDLDPEYTHQYRVTLRRIRSLCVLLRELIPHFEQRILKPHLKIMMKKTNKLRDLDVFILDKSQYIEMLPNHKSSLEPLFGFIESERAYEQAKVARWLATQEYTMHCTLVRNSLLRSTQHERVDNNVPALLFASPKVSEQFKKVDKARRKISDKSRDSVIHSMRIKCKALRYLLEGFSALYPSPQHKNNVKQLKLLQDKLGDFNDTSSQIEFFTQIKEAVNLNKQDRKTLKKLINVLSEHHALSRQTILTHLSQFESFIRDTNTQNLYRP